MMYCICYLYAGDVSPFTRKQVADMFYKGEIEEELRDEKYPSHCKWVMFKEEDIDMFMKKIVEERSTETYQHHPSKDCPARGMFVQLCLLV